MNKLKLLAAIATTGLLGMASQSAQAQAEAWQGPWVHAGVGAATFIPGFSGGQYLGAYPYSGSKKDINTAIASISAGYTLALSGPWSLGLGATIAPGTSPSADYAVLISTPRGVTTGPGTYNVANIYSITLQPGYAIDKEKLVYAKVGYTGATANTNSDSFGKASAGLSGYALGLGYKQMISGSLYGYAEFNYANYSNVNVPYSQLSGTINATGMDVMVGLGWRF
jgi:opacity protein-like surface antigen